MTPFEVGACDLDRSIWFEHGNTLLVQIVGNSFRPKVVAVPRATEVIWVNEEDFGVLDGELIGQHNSVVTP